MRAHREAPCLVLAHAQSCVRLHTQEAPGRPTSVRSCSVRSLASGSVHLVPCFGVPPPYSVCPRLVYLERGVGAFSHGTRFHVCTDLLWALGWLHGDQGDSGCRGLRGRVFSCLLGPWRRLATARGPLTFKFLTDHQTVFQGGSAVSHRHGLAGGSSSSQSRPPRERGFCHRHCRSSGGRAPSSHGALGQSRSSAFPWAF